MHVRIAWEIYNHQQKQQAEAKAGSVVSTKTELLRPPGHLYPGGPASGLGLGAPSMAPPFPTNMPSAHPAPPPPHPVGFLSTTASHLGNRGNKDSHLFSPAHVHVCIHSLNTLNTYIELHYNYQCLHHYYHLFLYYRSRNISLWKISFNVRRAESQFSKSCNFSAKGNAASGWTWFSARSMARVCI